ncbi:MAG: M81 family metallopeptidase [Trueperaceae bacterium]|nr:M81 family metallopeptidase [Trueperaceae bacterium]
MTAAQRPRVFLAGIVTETNTFSPIPTGARDFDVIRRVEEFAEGSDLAAIRDAVEVRGWELTFGLSATAQPAGLTVRRAYEDLRAELLDALRAAAPVDLVLLPLHGAMVAQGYDDCEGDLIEAVRQVVGEDVTIGVELDLHCHLTERMVAHADVIVIYQEYPHTDMATRAVELVDLCAEALKGAIVPTMAIFDLEMMGLYPTTSEPMRSYVDSMRRAEGTGGVLSLSLAHGFPWGDVPECGARMLAITDGDTDGAQRAAEAWGRRFYDLRDEVTLRPVPMEEAIERALAAPRGPVVLADQADNAGGGAPGDSTVVLRRLLERGVSDAGLAMIWDPVAVSLANAAGAGATLSLRLGGKMGAASGDPLDVEAHVIGVIDAMKQRWPQKEGAIMSPCGDAVALRIQGVDVIVASRRTQVFSPDVWTNFGIDPRAKRLLVVKSAQHFHAGFAPIASEIVYMAAPGAVAVDLDQVPYERVDRERYPWVEDPLPPR